MLTVGLIINAAGEDIRLENATFSWGQSTPTISNLSLRVRTGELVAVVGKVGAGKSSLLNAILGEMRKLEGNIGVREVRRHSLEYMENNYYDSRLLNDSVCNCEPAVAEIFFTSWVIMQFHSH